jgi:hypothetical protein
MRLDAIQSTQTWEKLRIAAFIGMMRRTHALQNRAEGKIAGPDHGSWIKDIEGACAESVVAEWANVNWHSAYGGADIGDVGPYEVRWTDDHNNRLILHDNDKRHKPYILVTGLAPTYFMQGWLFAYEGIQPENWSDPVGGRAAYFVSQRKLHSMATLPTYYKVKGVYVEV